MANEVKDQFAGAADITITLAGLVSSTARVGRASASIDNTTNRYQDVLIFLKIDLGASSTIDKTVQVFLLRDDNHATPLRTDGWGGTDAALTVLNAQLIGTLISKTGGEVLQGEFIVNRPGPKWGIAIVHDTVIALSATETDHVKRFVGINPEIQ